MTKTFDVKLKVNVHESNVTSVYVESIEEVKVKGSLDKED